MIRFVMICLFVAASSGCDKTETSSQPAADQPSTKVPDQPDEGPKPKDAAAKPKQDAAAAQPPVTVTTTPIAKVSSGKLTIDLPAGFEAGEADATGARFKGPEFGILVEIPAEGFTDLADERRLLKDSKVTTIAMEEWQGGVAIAYQTGDTIAAMTGHDKIGILCGGFELKTVEHARAALVICKSVRAARP